MRIPQTQLQNIKAGLHAVQAFFIFIAGCLSLAVLTKAGGSSGATGYMFGLVRIKAPQVESSLLTCLRSAS
jgi:hypothetical protein